MCGVQYVFYVIFYSSFPLLSLDITGPLLEDPSHHCINLKENSCTASHFDNVLAARGQVSLAYCYCLLRTQS